MAYRILQYFDYIDRYIRIIRLLSADWWLWDIYEDDFAFLGEYCSVTAFRPLPPKANISPFAIDAIVSSLNYHFISPPLPSLLAFIVNTCVHLARWAAYASILRIAEDAS